MPCVTVYWFFPAWIASKAAVLTESATSKSGRPIERLIGFFIDWAMSKALRMPEASMCCILSAIQASVTIGVRIGDGGSNRSQTGWRQGSVSPLREDMVVTALLKVIETT